MAPNANAPEPRHRDERAYAIIDYDADTANGMVKPAEGGGGCAPKRKEGPCCSLLMKFLSSELQARPPVWD